MDLFLTDSESLTAAAHALAFDHISVVTILPISVFYPENLNPLQRNSNKVDICENKNDSVNQEMKKTKLEENVKSDIVINELISSNEIESELNVNSNIPKQYNVEEEEEGVEEGVTTNYEKKTVKNGRNGNNKMIENNENGLKIENKSNVTLKSAFHIICQWGSIKCLRYLLDPRSVKRTNDVLVKNKSKCEFKKRDEFKNTPCKNSDDNDVILENRIRADEEIYTENSELKNTEMRLKFPLNSFLSDGTTPLHLAAKYGHISCLTELITAGADFRVFDCYGNTPLLLAQKWGRKDCETFLLSLY